ncbi:hypothetical protein OENI_60138 [Oenococcus oeni]|nr:hypothetical protein OENI_60138 [Oenococcus oeni]
MVNNVNFLLGFSRHRKKYAQNLVVLIYTNKSQLSLLIYFLIPYFISFL